MSHKLIDERTQEIYLISEDVMGILEELLLAESNDYQGTFLGLLYQISELIDDFNDENVKLLDESLDDELGLSF